MEIKKLTLFLTKPFPIFENCHKIQDGQPKGRLTITNLFFFPSCSKKLSHAGECNAILQPLCLNSDWPEKEFCQKSYKKIFSFKIL